MANTSILTKIDSNNSTNTITIYQPAPDYSGYITTLKATIRIKSISASNFPYIPDSTPPEAIEALLTQLSEELEYKEIVLKLKKGAGNWIEKNTIRLFNKDPYYEIDLMAYLTDANTVDMADDLQIGLQMVETLGAQDSIVVFGFVVEEKKTDDLEVLAARIEALELALYGRLTGLPANSLVGSIAGGIAENLDASAGRDILGLGTAALSDSSTLVDTTSNQAIGGKKSFTNVATSFGVGGECLSTVSSQLGFYSGYKWNGSNLLASTTSGGFIGINFYQTGIAFCYEPTLTVGTTSAGSATTKLLIGASNASFPIRPSTPGGGTFADSSDICLKKNIKPISGALEKICSLSGCEFDWKFDEDDIEIKPRTKGFIAQDIERVFPHWVHQDNDGIKSVSLPFEFFALLVEAIKELASHATN